MAMKRGRPNSWVWQWRGGRGKRIRGRCMHVELVLHAYKHLRWDDDAVGRVGLAFASDSTTTSLLKTTSLSPEVNLPIIHLLLPVRSRPLTRSGWLSSMFPTNCPIPSSLPSCASPTSAVSSLAFSPISRLGLLPPMPSTSDDEFTLPSAGFNPRRAAIKPF